MAKGRLSKPSSVDSVTRPATKRDDHFCTSEVASLCLALADEPLAASTLEAYLDVFSIHYLTARQQQPVDLGDALHLRLRDLGAPAGGQSAQSGS